MANPCEIVEEHGYLSDSFKFEIEKTIVEHGTIRDAVSISRSLTITETGNLGDDAYGNRSYTVTETGDLSDKLLLPHQTFTVREHGNLGDALSVRRALTVYESGAFGDAVTVGRQTTITETGNLSDYIFSGGRHELIVSEHGTIRDRLFYRRTHTFTESGNLGDALLVHRSLTVVETGSIGDNVFSGSRRSGVISESGSFNDLAFGLLRATMTVREDGCIHDTIIMPAANAAWTAPTKTFGMSQYNNWPINSMFRCDGKLVALGDAGAYILKGSKDAGANFLARVRTDVDDLGSSNIKRAGYIYATYKSDGNIRVRVTAHMSGDAETYAYDFEQRVANALTPGRAKMGRGLESIVYTFAFENINGSTLVMSAASAVTDQTSRKV